MPPGSEEHEEDEYAPSRTVAPKVDSQHRRKTGERGFGADLIEVLLKIDVDDGTMTAPSGCPRRRGPP